MNAHTRLRGHDELKPGEGNHRHSREGGNPAPQAFKRGRYFFAAKIRPMVLSNICAARMAVVPV